jgi:hypothetical protein
MCVFVSFSVHLEIRDCCHQTGNENKKTKKVNCSHAETSRRTGLLLVISNRNESTLTSCVSPHRPKQPTTENKPPLCHAQANRFVQLKSSHLVCLQIGAFPAHSAHFLSHVLMARTAFQFPIAMSSTTASNLPNSSKSTTSAADADVDLSFDLSFEEDVRFKTLRRFFFFFFFFFLPCFFSATWRLQ